MIVLLDKFQGFPHHGILTRKVRTQNKEAGLVGPQRHGQEIERGKNAEGNYK